MSQKFDHQAYAQLLSSVVPQVIETEAEYDRLLPIAERFTFAKNLTPEERALFKMIVLLIETYESEKYPITSEPHEILQHVMESSGISQADLAGEIGSSEAVSEIVSGERAISKR